MTGSTHHPADGPVVRVEFPAELAGAVRDAIADHRTGGAPVTAAPLEAGEPFVVEAPAGVVLALLGAAYLAVLDEVKCRGNVSLGELPALAAQVDWLQQTRTVVERARDAG